MKLIYHPDAERELIEAAQYYEPRVVTLGVQSLDDAEQAVSMIREVSSTLGQSSRKIFGVISCLAFRTQFTIAIIRPHPYSCF
jgi:hypothetical protein